MEPREDNYYNILHNRSGDFNVIYVEMSNNVYTVHMYA